MVAQRVADDPSAADVEDVCHVQPALAGGDVGDVPTGALGRFARGEVALDQIGKRRGGDVGDGGADLFAPAVFGVDAVLALQALDPLVVDVVSRRVDRRSSGGAAVGVVVAVVDLVHLVDDDGLVPLGLRRRLGPLQPVVVGRGGELGRFAGRLDRNPWAFMAETCR